jgi:hypothetical protein
VKHRRSTNDHGHATETPDVSHIRNVAVTHELSDVDIKGILLFVVGLSVLTAVVYVLVLLMFNYFKEKSKEPVPPPMAMTESERLPPEPRLQAAKGFGVKLQNGQWVDLEKKEPQEEYRVVHQQWEQILEQGPTDQNGNRVGLPIEEAKKKLLEGKALPSRTTGQGPRGGSEGYAVDMPTAASSGRVTEKRRE